MSTRKYEQRLRADAAEETRRRILAAVYERLCQAPTEPVSIEQVAKMAGVSRSTVYLVFGSRAGLFDALGDDLRGRGGFDRAADVTVETDARKGLSASIRASVPIFAEHREVLRVLYSMAQLDPDAVGGAVQRMADSRSAGMAWHARRLAEQDQLRPDVTVDEAAHLLWTLCGFETFDQLYTGRALPVDAVADLMVAIVERVVCA
ncbi:TetR/AcrR family transcriptional regulator [Amycolatopsis sp. SID8362]|uniref:TetR/AcrR family transcriptional regulator n=1 Tax=Amycolatopsis sp. SID8362 TaxID=2690346 RepID=UPI00136FE215|nr:TetR/AcrR family transcriptional regulator [Amycolatopsis sp. SID8362]NBH03179.1 TetR family transcriptional regulator [Amycolatopsis sp. SID8362]NED39880.1 TetR/AcrR family transcriptional regulator [Amycolatopsis sp. SID8362]